MKKILFLGLFLVSFGVYASQVDQASKNTTEELDILGKYGSSWSCEGQVFCDGMSGLYPEIVFRIVSERDYPRRLFSASIVPGKHLKPVKRVTEKEEEVSKIDQQKADEEFARMVALADRRYGGKQRVEPPLKRCQTVTICTAETASLHQGDQAVDQGHVLDVVWEERGSGSAMAGVHPNSTCAVGEGPRNLSDISLPADGSFGFNDKAAVSSSPQRVNSGSDVVANQALELESHHTGQVYQPSLMARLYKMFIGDL